MTAVRSDSLMESSDSSDCSLPTESPGNEDQNISSGVPAYRPGSIRCSDVAKIDAYNNNQLLLPAQFYKTLLAKAVLGGSVSHEDEGRMYKNMLFHAKERDFDQVLIINNTH